jgi:hypothetical protein
MLERDAPATQPTSIPVSAVSAYVAAMPAARP